MVCSGWRRGAISNKVQEAKRNKTNYNCTKRIEQAPRVIYTSVEIVQRGVCQFASSNVMAGRTKMKGKEASARTRKKKERIQKKVNACRK